MKEKVCQSIYLFIYLDLSDHDSYISRSLLYKPNNNPSKFKILVNNQKICLIRV